MTIGMQLQTLTKAEAFAPSLSAVLLSHNTYRIKSRVNYRSINEFLFETLHQSTRHSKVPLGLGTRDQAPALALAVNRHSRQ
jgi:hypothetical protein